MSSSELGKYIHYPISFDRRQGLVYFFTSCGKVDLCMSINERRVGFIKSGLEPVFAKIVGVTTFPDDHVVCWGLRTSVFTGCSCVRQTFFVSQLKLKNFVPVSPMILLPLLRISRVILITVYSEAAAARSVHFVAQCSMSPASIRMKGAVRFYQSTKMASEKYTTYLLEVPTPEELAAAVQKFASDYHCDDTGEMTRAGLVIIGAATALFDAGKNRDEAIEYFLSKGLDRGCAEPLVDKAKTVFDKAKAPSIAIPTQAHPSFSLWKFGVSIAAAAVATIGIGYGVMRRLPPEKQGCEHFNVKLEVRKLIAGQMAVMSQPMRPMERMIQSQIMADDSHTMADRIAAMFANPDKVMLADIRTESVPEDKAGKAIYFSCSAAALIQLPPSVVDRLSMIPGWDKATLVTDKGKAIVLSVTYHTRKTPEGTLTVDVKYQDPVIETLLRAVLATPDNK